MNKVAFIGAGNMAKAMIGGMLGADYRPSDIYATTASAQSAEALVDEFGLNITDNSNAMRSADIVVLAVKPNIMREVCLSLRDDFASHRPLVISVAAGLTCESIMGWLGAPNAPCVRCMPNTAAQVGLSASGAYANAEVSAEQKTAANALLTTMGSVTWVSAERDLDIVTAVAGSGVAYFYRFCELMIEAGTQMGLSHQQCTELAVGTAQGAGQVLAQSTQSPAALRKAVTSPNGTTERALAVFEKRQLGAIINEAMQDCAARSVEISQELGSKP